MKIPSKRLGTAHYLSLDENGKVRGILDRKIHPEWVEFLNANILD